MEFRQVIIWGHKLGSHTHSYIHHGLYRAFSHLGYPTYWYDDSDNVEGFNFANSLFLTEGQVDKKIPLREDSYYILHNCDFRKYLKYIIFDVYTDRCQTERLEKMEEYIYCSREQNTIYMPWATDLLPHEFPPPPTSSLSQACFIGSVNDGKVHGNLEEITKFRRACEENNILFISYGHYNGGTHPISSEENRKLVRDSIMAPSIQGKWQVEQGYIPCRIFKNISYGAVGATNSRTVWELFERKIVYNPDSYRLFYDLRNYLSTDRREEREEVIKMVRERHTYVNRAAQLIKFLKSIY